jgi:hypothetical protein
MKDHDHWGWHQILSWKVGFRRAKAGHALKYVRDLVDDTVFNDEVACRLNSFLH